MFWGCIWYLKPGKNFLILQVYARFFNAVESYSSVHIELFPKQREARRKAYHGVEAVNCVSKYMISKKSLPLQPNSNQN